MAAVDKLTPADPRVQHRFFTTGSRTYHYLLAEPDGDKSRRPAATVLLIHGFPDLAFGWRYQIPALLARRDNLRVVAPDMLGYGRSDAPRDPAAYSHKRVVDDLAALVRHVLAGDGEGGRVQAAEEEEEEEEEKIVLGGHDWGGAVAWRFALWYPGLVRAIFSVCTPYLAPAEAYLGLEEVVRRVPNFGYQLQFAGEEVEGNVVGRERIRAFLSLLYGAKGKDDGGRLFDAASGVALDKVVAGQVGESALLSREEMDFYADEYARNGMRGPLNWYRTRRFNFDEERKLVEQGRTRVTMPALMVVASRDPALPPAMAAVMDKHCDDLVKKEVNATHWALWEAPSEVNQHIGEFLDRILKDQPPKASI